MKILRMTTQAQIESGLSLRLMSDILYLKRPAKSKGEYKTITVSNMHSNYDLLLVELNNDKDTVNRFATRQDLIEWLWEDKYELDISQYDVSLTSDHVAIRLEWSDDILLMFYLKDKVWRALPRRAVDNQEVLWIADQMPQSKNGANR